MSEADERLITASGANDIQQLKEALDFGADANNLDGFGFTALAVS